MKILKPGSKSIHDGSQWEKGVWREELGATPGGPCGLFNGDGFHTFLGNDPLQARTIVFPCEVWSDEWDGEVARDRVSARVRRQRIISDITDAFPIVVQINNLCNSLSDVKWFKPNHEVEVPAYMSVEKMSLEEASGMVEDAPWRGGRKKEHYRANTEALLADRESASFGFYSISKTLGKVVSVARDALKGAALAILVSDLPASTVWLRRTWEAFTMGYVALYDDETTLYVADVSGGAK